MNHRRHDRDPMSRPVLRGQPVELALGGAILPDHPTRPLKLSGRTVVAASAADEKAGEENDRLAT